MKAGLVQEPEIVKKYIEDKTKHGNAVVIVQRCGFFVSKTHGFLGASPDEIVTDTEDEDTSGLKGRYVQTLESETLSDALVRKRICILENNKIKLNNRHQYYYQIQQQMFVTREKLD